SRRTARPSMRPVARWRCHRTASCRRNWRRPAFRSAAWRSPRRPTPRGRATDVRALLDPAEARQVGRPAGGCIPHCAVRARRRRMDAWVRGARAVAAHAGCDADLARHAADAIGVAGLTFLLLLVNEAITAALARRRLGARVLAVPLALAAFVPLLLAGYGAYALWSQPASGGAPLRVGLVQTNIVDYE